MTRRWVNRLFFSWPTSGWLLARRGKSRRLSIANDLRPPAVGPDLRGSPQMKTFPIFFRQLPRKIPVWWNFSSSSYAASFVFARFLLISVCWELRFAGQSCFPENFSSEMCRAINFIRDRPAFKPRERRVSRLSSATFNPAFHIIYAGSQYRKYAVVSRQ